MAPTDDPAFHRAMDNLMLQVDRDNILATHTVFQTHADNLRVELSKIRDSAQMLRCGEDPVSYDAMREDSFAGKINKLLEVHWRHWEELSAVAENLRRAARDYGHTESAITDSFPKPSR